MKGADATGVNTTPKFKFLREVDQNRDSDGGRYTMRLSNETILDLVRKKGVVPEDLPPGLDLPTGDESLMPRVGEID